MQTAPPEDLEEDVRELMEAKEEATAARSSWKSTAGSDGHSSTALMLAALKLTPGTVDAKFADATHFVAVVLSRLRRDPSSIEMRLWVVETHANSLWALRQQARVGSCEASRGSKEHSAEAHDGAANSDLVRWAPCCMRVAEKSKVKLWQALGDMSALDAQLRYIHILTELAPEWSNPLSTDSALLKTWTPDDESDRCAICDELFTFLNRRHHCRRCSNLVCAVCSPYSMPLRVFSQASEKPQRICTTCFREIEHHRVPATNGAPVTGGVRLNGISIRDPKAGEPMRRPSESSYSFAVDDEHEEATQPPPVPTSSLLAVAAAAAPTPAYKHSLSSVSATIQCGHLEFLHGAGFRKNWNAYFFVLLIRKGSLGMFLTETDHVEKKKRPAAVYKLSGYTIRIKSQKRRPHQFRLTHAIKKPLHFAATSIEEMNLWISQFIQAIDNANDLESQLTSVSPRGVETTAVATVPTVPALEDDETEV